MMKKSLKSPNSIDGTQADRKCVLSAYPSSTKRPTRNFNIDNALVLSAKLSLRKRSWE